MGRTFFGTANGHEFTRIGDGKWLQFHPGDVRRLRALKCQPQNHAFSRIPSCLYSRSFASIRGSNCLVSDACQDRAAPIKSVSLTSSIQSVDDCQLASVVVAPYSARLIRRGTGRFAPCRFKCHPQSAMNWPSAGCSRINAHSRSIRHVGLNRRLKAHLEGQEPSVRICQLTGKLHLSLAQMRSIHGVFAVWKWLPE